MWSVFNAFWSQASLFWLFTNHLDNRVLLAVDDLLLDLAKGLVFHPVFGSFSDMAGFALTDWWSIVYYEWSGIGLAIPRTAKGLRLSELLLSLERRRKVNTVIIIVIIMGWLLLLLLYIISIEISASLFAEEI